MKHIKLFEEHLPDLGGWIGMDLPKFKKWWVNLVESDQKTLLSIYFPEKCEGNCKYFPSDKEIKDMWLEETSEIVEGKTFKDTKSGLFPKKPWDPNKKRDFLLAIKNHVKSKGLTSKQVGNDLEIICDDKMISQIMFRDKYVGVRAKGAKFTDEFEYTELGKIKAKISEIVKDCK